MDKVYLKLPTIKVSQPLGDFFVISISARKLLNVAFSEPLKYINENGKLTGGQRVTDVKRLKEIGKYIESAEMAFPNSIILAANYTESGFITQNSKERWSIIDENGNLFLVIPFKSKLAAIIDGQHRLQAFSYVENESLLDDVELLCSVYFDLTNSYQAYLFATINSNQKKVDRSLALDHFGYNVEEEPSDSWTPEKFAVFLSRKFNVDVNSPFYNHIKVAPQNRELIFSNKSKWEISTATVVDGICSLITSNAKRDRIIMQKRKLLFGRDRKLLFDQRDYSPLRTFYLESRDQDIFDIIFEYFAFADNYLWKEYTPKSYIFKTVGVQALFELLKLILSVSCIKKENLDSIYVSFDKILSNAQTIDFSDKFFQASGIGKTRIKNIIALQSALISIDKIKESDRKYYLLLLEGSSTDTLKEKWMWDEEAEIMITNIMDKAVYNYDNNSVSVFLEGEYDEPVNFTNFVSLFKKLCLIAEETFVSYLPSDTEFADEQREKFEPEQLVLEILQNHTREMKKLGWKVF